VDRAVTTFFRTGAACSADGRLPEILRELVGRSALASDTRDAVVPTVPVVHPSLDPSPPEVHRSDGPDLGAEQSGVLVKRIMALPVSARILVG
jgi:hypothetical protein